MTIPQDGIVVDATPALEDAPPARRRTYVRPNPRIIESILPVAAYVVVNMVAPTPLAIVASFAASAVVFARNRQHGTIRALGVLGFVIVAASAIIGLAGGGGKAFVAQNLVGDFIFAAVFAASIPIGKPLMGAIVRELVPALQPVMAIDHPLFVRLTIVNAAINLASGVSRIFLIDALSSNQYVIVSRVIFLPISMGFYFLCYVLVHREAFRIWPEDMPAPNRDGTAGS